MKRTLLMVLLLAPIPSGLAATASAQNPPGAPAAPPATADFQTRIEAYLRKLYAWGPMFQVKVGALSDAELAGFYRVTVEVSVGSDKDTTTIHISKDGRHLIRGDVLDTTADPFAVNRQKISLTGRPAQGPENASVVVVDFSDFQCPHCKQLDAVLRQIKPQYTQVRFISKNFPLAQIHPWAMTAATAGECAFWQNPEAYWAVHHAIFDQQEKINPTNAWETMLDIATQAGLEQTSFRACMASPEAKRAVEEDLKEGQSLRIANTPTVFVNGRRLLDPNLLRQYIDYELSAAGGKPAGPR